MRSDKYIFGPQNILIFDAKLLIQISDIYNVTNNHHIIVCSNTWCISYHIQSRGVSHQSNVQAKIALNHESYQNFESHALASLAKVTYIFQIHTPSPIGPPIQSIIDCKMHDTTIHDLNQPPLFPPSLMWVV